ncbi:hypothetical protein AYI70_g4942 [Smittium culicis]|uniref:Uncharacterized protein n=1 Tax=Smittium culicis TaxID=133412 RepID=A0A1R1XWZ4_9FUNG|nr:hypothetical protein AYI70_g4942 [Smittium culicis]
MTQTQFGVHCLKANPIAFFADSSIHRSTVDDRPVISSFPVGYSDVNLTDRILRDKFFDRPGTPTHPCGHPGRQWYLDEVDHLWYERSRAVLVRVNAELMVSSSMIRSMAADFPTLATIRIALSISICMGFHLASVMPNVSSP